MSTAVHGPLAASSRNRLILHWIPTILWLALIASFSTDTFSAKHTGGILFRISHALTGEVSPEAFLRIHVFIRKAAHFTVYGVLSLLAFRSWRATLPGSRRWTFSYGLLALALTLAAACLDEFHQSFVPSRTASPYDVMLDMMGGIFIQVLIAGFTTPQLPPPGKAGRA